MVITRQAGKPNNNTTGGVGDIYIDISTGQQYKCTFAYRSSGGDAQKNWKPFDGDVVVDVAPVLEIPEINVGIAETGDVVKPEILTKTLHVPEEEKAQVTEEVKEEPKPVETTNRTRYSDYSKQNKQNKR